MKTFFFAMAIAAAALVYYNQEVKYQLMLWSNGSSVGSGYHSGGSSITRGMSSFGSSLGNSYESMGKSFSGN